MRPLRLTAILLGAIVVIWTLAFTLAAVAGASTVHRRPAPIVNFAHGLRILGYHNSGFDGLGDCVLSASAAIEEVVTGHAASYAEVYTDYRLFVPTGVTGVDPVAWMNYWETTGLGGVQITGWSDLGHQTDRAAIEGLINQDHALFATLDVPDPKTVWEAMMWGDSIDNFEAWDLASAPKNPKDFGYHAVAVVGYAKAGLLVKSAGVTMLVSWPYWTVHGVDLIAVSF